MAKSKNTRFGRGRYNDDYAPDENGVYHYIGSYFVVALEPKPLRAAKGRIAACALVQLAAFALGGLSNGVTARTFYALLPFICCMLPVGYMLLGLVSWLAHREPRLTRKGMDETIDRMKHSAVGLMCCAALALAGGVLACILHRSLPGELTFLLSALALLLCGAYAHQALKAMPIRRIDRGQNDPA